MLEKEKFVFVIKKPWPFNLYISPSNCFCKVEPEDWILISLGTYEKTSLNRAVSAIDCEEPFANKTVESLLSELNDLL